MSVLEIKNLHVNVETDQGTREILRGVDLVINEGEIHAVMGPNGSGKSTLAYTIAGHPKYHVVQGEILLGGEKKRNEILQLELLKPRFAVLDETDSGLDVDALKIVSEGVNRAKANTGLGILLITHYTRILRYIKPDFVHVFVAGRIAEQGGPELADRLEDEGYDRYQVPEAAAAE